VRAISEVKNVKRIEDFESFKKWLAWKAEKGKPYTEGTKRLYLKYMENIFCKLTGKTPDELANVTREQADVQRGEMASKMRSVLHLSVSSIEYRVHALNQFYRANNIRVSDPYGGIERVDVTLWKDIKRVVTLQRSKKPPTLKWK
jgi:hypothetical protein